MSDGEPLAVWEGRPVEQLRVHWTLPALRILRETGSTNDVARELADRGAPAGLLVMAEHQAAGRGRMGRRWSDSPRQALLLSFLLRPEPFPEPVPGTAPIRVGLAVARALRRTAALDVRLKWPNDVIVPGRGKLAGILCEAATAGGTAVVIAGIGINVAQRPDDWPPELGAEATSVAIATGMRPDRAAIMDAICDAIRPLFTAPLRPLSAAELDDWRALDALLGRRVTATGSDAASGTAIGIDPDGALLITTGGTTRRIVTATVRITDTATSTAPADS